MTKQVLEREDLKKEYTWDVESLFANVEEWEKEFKRVEGLVEKFVAHKGRVGESSQTLLEVLKDRDRLYRSVENVLVYARLRLDEDTRRSKYQSLSDRAMNLYVEVDERTSFVVPEILAIDEEDLKKFLEENQELSLYKQHLDNIMRQKPHVLSSREESIMARVNLIGMSPQNIYNMLTDADLKFPTIKDEEGKDVEITHGNFIPLMESKDRNVRKAAFQGLYGVYKGFENTLAATLSGELRNNVFNARMRNYSSTREAALSANNIPLSVYDNLIKAVHKNLDSMYKYMEIRKRALGLDELHMYDLYTPIVEDIDFNIPYEEGMELVYKGLEPLEDEYLSVVEKGFKSRWVDVYENRGKRSGAYSSGSYDSKPFILLNYQNTLDSVFTLAHEMGHSVHSYFTRKNQPYIYGNYSIFLAEVASTANEALLLDYMINNTKDKKERVYLINHYLESFRTTVFRQTMFAEFEKIINEHLEAGHALTAEYLCSTYKELNELYYGPNVVVDDEISIEWARIPHFYLNYYVYQYATGFSAAIDLTQKILQEKSPAVENYLNFLKSGSSDYPINVLKKVGIDMTTEEPVDNAMDLFARLVNELDELI
ncbi:MAG TPA: oligoendopeptidase F [Tissierellaceae bacterium]|nr:oligoendopeptidase F [Tissierellaceae bacterium]